MRTDNELSRQAFDTIYGMKRATSLKKLDGIASSSFRAIDLPYFALARFFQPDRTSDVRVLLGSFEPSWASRYVQNKYGRSSRIAREMIHRSSPYSWSEAVERRGLDATQARIWNEARDFGLRDGLFTPLRWHDGSYAAVVLGGAEAPMRDPLSRTMAEVLSAQYASEGRRLLKAGSAGEVPLSPRQRECLSWVRAGKSSTAIAEILGISVQTVDEHVKEACRRLGVRTRVQAAVEACLLGYID
jgi:LuxR family quorum-sensing system transcriptional regulator CciR